jgi:hypothetical protein
MNNVIRLSVSAVIVASVVAALAGQSHAQFSAYDNFNFGTIDPSLWEGVSVEGNFNAPTAEMIRSAETGALRLKLVAYGNDTSNSGNISPSVSLQFRQLGTTGGTGSIIGIKARVTVQDAATQDCAANSGPLTRARAQINGWFFNDGSSTGSTDSTGNIVAGFQLTKEGDGSNQVQGFLLRCTNSTCGTFETPAGIANPTFLTAWSPNTPLVLKLRVDRANGKVKFLVTNPNIAGSAESAVIDYLGIVNDAGPATNGDFKVLRVQNSVKNCLGDRKQVMMDALFDNIAVQRAP